MLLNKPGTVSSTKGGWMMISTILIEACFYIPVILVLAGVGVSSTPQRWRRMLGR